MTEAGGAALQRGEGVALWRQVEQAIAMDIRSGAHAAAGRLPTEGELAARFAVNRHTVRRALAALADKGLVRTEQGRGSFVQDVVLDYPLRRRTSFSANLLEQDRVPSHEVLEVAEAVATAAIAAALDVREGSSVASAVVVGQADRVPITFSRSFLPLARLAGVLEALRREPSMSRVYAAVGVRSFRRRSTRITARLPSDMEAAHLKQAMNLPVLVTDAVDVDQDGRPIRYGISCFAGARVQLTVDPEA